MSSVYQDFIDGYFDPVTEEQQKAINFIEDMVDVKFTGKGKDDAIIFISKNIEEASYIRGKQIQRRYYSSSSSKSRSSSSSSSCGGCSGNCRGCMWSGSCDGEDELEYEKERFYF